MFLIYGAFLLLTGWWTTSNWSLVVPILYYLQWQPVIFKICKLMDYKYNKKTCYIPNDEIGKKNKNKMGWFTATNFKVKYNLYFLKPISFPCCTISSTQNIIKHYMSTCKTTAIIDQNKYSESSYVYNNQLNITITETAMSCPLCDK